MTIRAIARIDALVGLNCQLESIPSGAGHDAALFANAGIPSGMLFIRNRNGSHNPDEAMEMDDFMQGVRVLSDAVDQLA